MVFRLSFDMLAGLKPFVASDSSLGGDLSDSPYAKTRINITSKSVKECVFSGYNSHHEIDTDEDYIDCIQINAPYISSLTIESDLVLRELALHNVKQDPFSLLQEDILLDIMSRIECTTKELIRTTSTISKRWRNLWASVPHLIFHELEDDVDTRTNIQPYISFIDNTINQCPTYPNLKLFKFHTNYDTELNPEFKSRVNSWIRYAISRNVEEFDLRFWDLGGEGEFTYDDELFFNSSCITRITLTWCLFNPPNGVISWGGLESLCITCGTLDEDMLEKILSGSPCLETLELDNCYGYRRINITSKSVKEFVFSGYNSHHEIDTDEDYIDCIQINAPYISSLTIESDLVLRELALHNVSSLMEADLDYSID
ncbi:ribonuclease H-like domain-containing protein [Tanacetum coccineum]